MKFSQSVCRLCDPEPVAESAAGNWNCYQRDSGGPGTTGGDVSGSKQPGMSARQFTQLPAGDPRLL